MYLKGPNDLLHHGDEHLEELEDWELRERFFSVLRDLATVADSLELKRAIFVDSVL
jgi:hypothetical protein